MNITIELECLDAMRLKTAAENECRILQTAIDAAEKARRGATARVLRIELEGVIRGLDAIQRAFFGEPNGGVAA